MKWNQSVHVFAKILNSPLLALTACFSTLLEFSSLCAVDGLTRSSAQGNLDFLPFLTYFLITGDLKVYRAQNFVSFWILKLGCGLGALVGGFFELGPEHPRVLDFRVFGKFPVGTDQKGLILAVHPGEKFSSLNHFLIIALTDFLFGWNFWGNPRGFRVTFYDV